MVPQLIVPRTNPSGAVCMLKHEKKNYCFSVSCTSCQIPLLNANILPPNEETENTYPRLKCSFCSATYNLKTGEPCSTESSGGLGGVIKNIFAAKDRSALPIYDLSE